LLFNANNEKEINRVSYPAHILRIRYSFMTEEYDLMVLMETEENYELYCIDLDDFEDTVHK
jgi:hypothetical protein